MRAWPSSGLLPDAVTAPGGAKGANVMRKTTISDVALAAGCSKATVSYVINRNRPISKEVRERVLEAARRLGYRPSGRRNLPQRRGIALLVRGDFRVGNEPAFTFSQEIIRRGYVPQIFMCPSDIGETRRMMASIGNDRNVAGVINTVPDLGSMDLLKYCWLRPSLIYARNDCMLCSVRCNYLLRMRLALSHLFSLGHRKALFFIDPATRGKPQMINNLKYLREYSETFGMQWRLLEHPEQRDNPALFGKLDAEWARGFTAVLAWNDFFASMVYQWAYERRLRIPERLSVIAFCDDFSAQAFAPPLTSVQIPLELLVRHTVDALIARMEERQSEEIVLVPFLCERGSTGPLLK